MKGHHRPQHERLAIGISLVSTNLLLVCVWLWWAFGTQNGFADLAVDVLKDPSVRSVVAEQVVGALESQGMTSQVAIAAGPALEPVVASVVGTDAFTGLVYAGARQLHETIFLGNRAKLLVRVDDSGQMVKDSLRVMNPGLADTIPDRALDIAVGVSQNTRIDALIHVAAFTGWLIWPLAGIALLSAVTATVRSSDRRRAVLRLGLGLGASGLLWFLILGAAVAVVSRFVDGATDRSAVRALFRSLTHVLMLASRSEMNVGIVITLAALVAGEQRLRGRMRAALAWAQREWARPTLHGSIGALIVVVGVLVAVYPEVVLALVARSVGLLLAFLGLVAVLDVLGAYGWAGAGDGRESSTVRHVLVIAGASAAAIVLLLSLSGMSLYQSLNASHTEAPDVSKGCNGHVELCERRLDQVVLPATHNSMSASSERGWFFARQTGGIGAQLARGVRAFLVDAHYGTKISGTVRTDFGSEAERLAAYQELSSDQQTALDRLLALTGATPTSTKRRGVYLCHVYCELGATPAAQAFATISGFLAENPNEVVVLVVEDHAGAADVEAALRKGGLEERAFAHTPGDPLPTLREMIESRRNLLVMAESNGDQSWYPAGYGELLQDTPYRFAAAEDFTCELGRGNAQNALLLVNHWLSADPASTEVAAKVNSSNVLLERVKSCQSDRGRLPNLIAVDFYAAGDLFDVVDQLNGVARPVTA